MQSSLAEARIVKQLIPLHFSRRPDENRLRIIGGQLNDHPQAPPEGPIFRRNHGAF